MEEGKFAGFEHELHVVLLTAYMLRTRAQAQVSCSPEERSESGLCVTSVTTSLSCSTQPCSKTIWRRGPAAVPCTL